MMDYVLAEWVSGIIEWKRNRWMLGAGRSWQPGERLKLLFAGYNGARNTGSRPPRSRDAAARFARFWAPNASN